jgi:hypothetical protein
MPPTVDLCGPDGAGRVPHMRQGKRPFAPTEPAEQTIPATSGADKDDCSTGRNSDHPTASATSGADKGDGNQTVSDCASVNSKKTKKESSVQVAASSGADNNKGFKTPVGKAAPKRPKFSKK